MVKNFLLKILLYLINFRSRGLNAIAATNPFEQKNRKTTQSNARESIEMVGIFFCLYDILMYNMRPSLFCGGDKGKLKLRWSLQVPTANCLSVLASSCPWWVG